MIQTAIDNILLLLISVTNGIQFITVPTLLIVMTVIVSLDVRSIDKEESEKRRLKIIQNLKQNEE